MFLRYMYLHANMSEVGNDTYTYIHARTQTHMHSFKSGTFPVHVKAYPSAEFRLCMTSLKHRSYAVFGNLHCICSCRLLPLPRRTRPPQPGPRFILAAVKLDSREIQLILLHIHFHMYACIRISIYIYIYIYVGVCTQFLTNGRISMVGPHANHPGFQVSASKKQVGETFGGIDQSASDCRATQSFFYFGRPVRQHVSRLAVDGWLLTVVIAQVTAEAVEASESAMKDIDAALASSGKEPGQKCHATGFAELHAAPNKHASAPRRRWHQLRSFCSCIRSLQ